ncbi:hypothetical protein [Conexibacter woesei]|uniref:Uncharacterized protein n=1 Tax=Conexibacter woesei (strain DSM 14684 / CCUG 47730 / CIP 108061 / JCM 11494 / NBRC 100937 / ID131577) TaxID=469383 RepID=D3FE98_CONWI|nr:hypothetical protein [Conexibacter woesei]ADB53590.1 hypothetical protein Cwoe_5182 [Conexibacter woesei DSM 14684]
MQKAGAHPDEIAAVPDLRPTLRTAEPDKLADLFEAFDVTATYDKTNRQLKLAATVTPELIPEKEKPRPASPVGEFVHSGGGF